jgi:hypothetical protein
MVDRHQATAELQKQVKTGLVGACRMEDDDIRWSGGSAQRYRKRLGAHGVIVVGDESDIGVPRLTHETDFSLLPSGSRLIVAAMSFVQAEIAGTRDRSTR